jgi:hypothetical protein
MKKHILYLSFVFCPTLFLASSIPQYQLSSSRIDSVTLANQAIFKTFINPGYLFWEPFDEIEIVMVLDFARSVKLIGDRYEACPNFLIHNLTKSLLVLGRLEQPPNMQDMSTFGVLSIDRTNRIVTLSDTSNWLYPESEDIPFGFWQIGDLVMIANLSTLHSESNVVLFNTFQQHAAIVLQTQ